VLAVKCPVTAQHTVSNWNKATDTQKRNTKPTKQKEYGWKISIMY